MPAAHVGRDDKGEMVRWDEDEVDGHAAVLLAFDGEVEYEHRVAISFFRKILSIEDSPPIDQVIKAGLLPAFKRIIDDSEDNFMIHQALWCATNVASGSAAHTRAAVEAGLLECAMSYVKPFDRAALLLTDELKALGRRPVRSCAAVAGAAEGEAKDKEEGGPAAEKAKGARAAARKAAKSAPADDDEDEDMEVDDEDGGSAAAGARDADDMEVGSPAGKAARKKPAAAAKAAPGAVPPGVYFLAGADGQADTNCIRVGDLVPDAPPVLGTDLAEQAAWLIGNCTGDSPAHRDAALAAGTAAAFAETLKDLYSQLHELDEEARDAGEVMLLHPRVAVLLRTFAWAMSNLARGKPHPDLHLLRPLIPFAVGLSTCCDGQVAIDGGWFAAYIAENNGWDGVGGLADHKIPALPAGLTADYLCDVLDLPATADTTFTFVDLLTYRLSAARTQCEDGALAGDWKNLAVTAQRALGNLATGDAATTEKVVSSRAMDEACLLALTAGHAGLMKEAWWMLSNVVADSEELAARAAVSPIVRRLLAATLCPGVAVRLAQEPGSGVRLPWDAWQPTPHAVLKEVSWTIANMLTKLVGEHQLLQCWQPFLLTLAGVYTPLELVPGAAGLDAVEAAAIALADAMDAAGGALRYEHEMCDEIVVGAARLSPSYAECSIPDADADLRRAVNAAAQAGGGRGKAARGAAPGEERMLLTPLACLAEYQASGALPAIAFDDPAVPAGVAATVFNICLRHIKDTAETSPEPASDWIGELAELRVVKAAEAQGRRDADEDGEEGDYGEDGEEEEEEYGGSEEEEEEEEAGSEEED